MIIRLFEQNPPHSAAGAQNKTAGGQFCCSSGSFLIILYKSVRCGRVSGRRSSGSGSGISRFRSSSLHFFVVRGFFVRRSSGFFVMRFFRGRLGRSSRGRVSGSSRSSSGVAGSRSSRSRRRVRSLGKSARRQCEYGAESQSADGREENFPCRHDRVFLFL